jgi:hypothetical protein
MLCNSQDHLRTEMRDLDHPVLVGAKNIDRIPTKGRSGGVLTGINSDRFDVRGKEQGVFALQHYLWDKKLERKWNLINVYGATWDEDKENFLT